MVFVSFHCEGENMFFSLTLFLEILKMVGANFDANSRHDFIVAYNQSKQLSVERKSYEDFWDLERHNFRKEVLKIAYFQVTPFENLLLSIIFAMNEILGEKSG